MTIPRHNHRLYMRLRARNVYQDRRKRKVCATCEAKAGRFAHCLGCREDRRQRRIERLGLDVFKGRAIGNEETVAAQQDQLSQAKADDVSAPGARGGLRRMRRTD